MFTEAWVLHTHPDAPQGSRQIQFRGAAVAPNVQGRERRKLGSMLIQKEKHAKVCRLLLDLTASCCSIIEEPTAQCPPLQLEYCSHWSAFSIAFVMRAGPSGLHVTPIR